MDISVLQEQPNVLAFLPQALASGEYEHILEPARDGEVFWGAHVNFEISLMLVLHWVTQEYERYTALCRKEESGYTKDQKLHAMRKRCMLKEKIVTAQGLLDSAVHGRFEEHYLDPLYAGYVLRLQGVYGKKP